MARPDHQLNGWPDETRWLASAEFTHALGNLTLAYNFLEEAIGMLFSTYMPIDKSAAEALYHKLNNRERIDLLTALLGQNEKRPDVQTSVLHLVACYDICTENRNILMHSITTAPDAQGMFRLGKRARNDPKRTTEFQVDTTKIRQIADETSDIFDAAVMLHLWLHNGGPNRDANVSIVMGWPEPPAPVPLPPIPPKPRKLIPYQPPEDQKDGPPQP